MAPVFLLAAISYALENAPLISKITEEYPAINSKITKKITAYIYA